jgi:transcriptional regulator with XRE-family HTH domain
MQYANGCVFDVISLHGYSPRMNIGDRLDKAMKDAKITSQSALARASGVPQATISRILSGGDGKKGPETATLRKLAGALNVSFDWLNEGIPPERGISLVEGLESPEVSGDEILELVTAYLECSPAIRNVLMKSAKAGARRAESNGLATNN